MAILSEHPHTRWAAPVEREQAASDLSGRPDLNRRPLDPRNGGVGVFAAQMRSACEGRRVATCGLFGGMDTVWSPGGPQRSGETALFGSWADIGAPAGDSEDEALIAQDLDRAQYSVAADVVLLLKLLDRRQWTIGPLALGDLGSEYGG